MYDLDYDYEPEPYDTDCHTRTYEYNDEQFEVIVKVDTWQIRAGNYSPVASDPEEYYGTYTTTYEIIDSSIYNPDIEDWSYLDYEDIPKWVLDEVAREFEE